MRVPSSEIRASRRARRTRDTAHGVAHAPTAFVRARSARAHRTRRARVGGRRDMSAYSLNHWVVSSDDDDDEHGGAGGAGADAQQQHAQLFTAALLAAGQRAAIWSDCKDFVDTRARSPPAKIYEALKTSGAATCSVAARAFLEEHFETGPRDRRTTPELVDWREEPNVALRCGGEKARAFTRHVHDLWKILARLDADDYVDEESPVQESDGDGESGAGALPQARTTSSRIKLPYPAVVPGERFRETYYWDTYWIVLGLLTSEMPATALGVTNNLLYMVTTYGFVPNGARVYYLNRSQPPLLTSCVAAVYEATRDGTWLRQALPLLVQEYSYLMRSERVITVRDAETGENHQLSRYFANTTRPRPESYREDVEVARLATRKCDNPIAKVELKRKIYRHIASAAESGFDFSSRWFRDGKRLESIRTCDIIPSDLNGFMLRVELQISALAREALAIMGPGESGYAERVYLKHLVTKFEAAGQARRRAIHAVLWDDDAARWRDVAFESRPGELVTEIVRDRSALSFASKSPFTSDYTPLWCGAADPNSEQAYRVVESLKTSGLVTANGVATSLNETGQQWDWPNAWAPTSHMIIEAIQAYAPREENYAKELAHAWLRTSHSVWTNTGYMHEKYDVRVGHDGVGGGGEYVPQRGFGWTNGVTLRLLDLYGFPDDDIVHGPSTPTESPPKESPASAETAPATS